MLQRGKKMVRPSNTEIPDMQKRTLAVVTALLVAGATAGTFVPPAVAQAPAVQDDGGPSGPDARPGAMDHRPWQHPGPRGMHGMHGERGPWRTFSLLYNPADRALTAPEVQKIAEAFLLWHGNRTWKVTDVAEAADNQIAFSFATPEGSVVARFTMDRRTGRVHRVS
jgi:hypothetical protein